MKKLVSLSMACLLIALTSYAQKKDRRNGVYSAYLYSVERNPSTNEAKLDSLASSYEDDILLIKWDYAYTQIGFDLTNKSEKTIRVIWDDAAYISITNESGRVFHKGIKYTERESSQPATPIYKGTTLSDLVAPTSYSYYSSGQYGGWNSRLLLPVKRGGGAVKIEYLPEFIGRTMKVVIPIKIDETTFEYIFSFRTTFLQPPPMVKK